MINAILAAEELLASRVAHTFRSYPKQISTVIGAALLCMGGGAFAVASLGPDVADLPVTQVLEAVQPLASSEQVDALDTHDFTLFRTELTRSSDTIEALLKRLGIADPACPVKFVITQKALAEGWDCPFAYILVSMASLSSATAVEQLLGRVLRQPDAAHRQAKALNQSYAFVVSRNFAETAGALRDRLVAGAGFERREVTEFVTAAKAEQAGEDNFLSAVQRFA